MKQLMSVVVPCYNEQEVLQLFYQEITRAAAQLSELDFEFLFIDDGSKDRTLEILKELAGKDPRVVYLSFSRNFGKEAGIYAGFVHAKGDWVVLMDADLQDPPALLPEMYRYVCKGEYDSVATCRVSRAGEPPIRSFFARQFYKLINRISDAEIRDGARDYRLMSRKMVDAILSMSETNRFTKGIFGWIGFRTKWLEYQNVERAAGETKWSFWKLFKYSVDGIVNFSTVPLQISSFFGLFFCFLAFVATVFVVLRKLIFGDPVDGWASLATIILFCSGIQLFCIGILGQYLARTYLETKHRPLYIIAESNVK